MAKSSVAQCAHKSPVTIATHCFTGSVAREENRAAHGNITETHECPACGAQRAANVNQRHVELGAWGPSRAERQTALRARIARAESRAPAAPAPITLSKGAQTASVACDAEGYLVIDGPFADRERIARALPAEWLEAAKARRAAMLRVSALRSEVAA